MPYYAIIDHLMHKDLLKILLILISGDNRGLNFTRKIVPSFVRVLPLEGPFSTGGEQYKQAVETQSRVTTTA